MLQDTAQPREGVRPMHMACRKAHSALQRQKYVTEQNTKRSPATTPTHTVCVSVCVSVSVCMCVREAEAGEGVRVQTCTPPRPH